MEPKTAPYGPQDGIKIDVEAILRGFDIRTLEKTIRPVWQVGCQKSSLSKNFVSKMRLGSHPKAARKRSREKRQHREAKEVICSAFVMKDT